VLENRGRIFRIKGEELTAEWRKLHNEELYNLFSSTCLTIYD
jgi:hypothetical protein